MKDKAQEVGTSIRAELDRKNPAAAAMIAARYVERNDRERNQLIAKGLDPEDDQLDLELLNSTLQQAIACRRRDKKLQKAIGMITSHLRERLDSRQTRAVHRAATAHRRQSVLDSLVPASA